jgi:hypothetical protein
MTVEISNIYSITTTGLIVKFMYVDGANLMCRRLPPNCPDPEPPPPQSKLHIVSVCAVFSSEYSDSQYSYSKISLAFCFTTTAVRNKGLVAVLLVFEENGTLSEHRKAFHVREEFLKQQAVIKELRKFEVEAKDERLLAHQLL